VIFDGDNTLWDVESLYDQARENLCNLVERLGGNAQAAELFQRARDTELYERHGYAAHRFPQSFADTVRHCLGRDDPVLEEKARDIAAQVFRVSAPLVADVDLVLRRVRSRYALALLTAGDKAVQAQRLDDFGRTGQFNAVRVVERKSEETLSAFLEDHSIDRRRAWVVGDSIRSDIEPALLVGVRAIHVEVANWHPVETIGRELPPSVRRVSCLLEVCEILGC